MPDLNDVDPTRDQTFRNHPGHLFGEPATDDIGSIAQRTVHYLHMTRLLKSAKFTLYC